MESLATRAPDLFERFVDALTIEKYGDAAFKICDFPVQSASWRSDMRQMALFLKQLELRAHYSEKSES